MSIEAVIDFFRSLSDYLIEIFVLNFHLRKTMYKWLKNRKLR